MKTTALFVELLVIGAIASIWIALFLIKDIDQYEFYEVHRILAENIFILTAIAIPMVYTIGIIFDKLAKYIFLLMNSLYSRIPVCTNCSSIICKKYEHFYQVLDPFWFEKDQSRLHCRTILTGIASPVIRYIQLIMAWNSAWMVPVSKNKICGS